MMNTKQAMEALDAGKRVFWSHTGYVCLKDNLGQYLIKCTMNGHIVGMQSEQKGFFVFDYEQLKNSYREAFDSGDPWGSSMNAAFALCAELSHREKFDVPALMQYSPGAVNPENDNRDKEEYLFEAFDSADTESLERFGRLLNRHLDICKALGKDY